MGFRWGSGSPNRSRATDTARSIPILREIAVSPGLHRRKRPAPYQPTSGQPMPVIASEKREDGKAIVAVNRPWLSVPK